MPACDGLGGLHPGRFRSSERSSERLAAKGHFLWPDKTPRRHLAARVAKPTLFATRARTQASLPKPPETRCRTLEQNDRPLRPLSETWGTKAGQYASYNGSRGAM